MIEATQPRSGFDMPRATKHALRALGWLSIAPLRHRPTERRQGAVRRFAFVIGNDRSDPAEVGLRYAESDQARIARAGVAVDCPLAPSPYRASPGRRQAVCVRDWQ